MTTGLAILLDGTHVADVERTRRGVLRLAYHDDLPAGATPLSLALPPQRGRFHGDAVETYLWGLLPESEEARSAIRRTHGADPRDPLSLLAAIGKDCAGAVQFCEPDDVVATLAREGRLEPVTDSDLESRLAAMRLGDEPSWMLPEEHWSLGGMQQKLALRRESGRWHYATGAEATTHIVKPGVRQVKAQALIEHVTMRAARALGVAVAATDFVDFRSERAIVIERFDRARDDAGRVRRLHQEDLCQALGVREKYEDAGGPSAARLVRLLRDSAATAADARRNTELFLDGLVFNTVVASPDAHARNYAVLLDGDHVHLAPLYDVATGLAYSVGPRAYRRLSMSIGGVFDREALDAEAWRRCAGDLDVDETSLLDLVHRMTAGATAAFAAALDEVEDWDGSVSDVRARLLPNLESLQAWLGVPDTPTGPAG